ncbi:MAG: hypothetical protein ACI906_004453, partial [Candidatus Latescibacterota bacterium]
MQFPNNHLFCDVLPSRDIACSKNAGLKELLL